MVISYIYSICWHIKLAFYERQHDAFPSFDVFEIVDQQNSWNFLVIGTYLLYLA
jgi:hypothetical protein